MKIEEVLNQNLLVINPILLKLIKEHKLDINEFLLIVYLVNDREKVFDIDKISKNLCIDEKEVLVAFNSLIKKKLISVNSIKDKNAKINERIDLSLLYGSLKNNINEEHESTTTKNIYDIFEQEFGRPISSMQYEIIKAWIEEKKYSEEIIIGALKEAVYNGVSNFRYIDKILYEWSKKGIKTMNDVKTHLKSRNEEKNSSKELFDYNWLDDEDNE